MTHLVLNKRILLLNVRSSVQCYREIDVYHHSDKERREHQCCRYIYLTKQVSGGFCPLNFTF